MVNLPTVLLHHTTRSGSHYDWLLAPPGAPGGPLRTWRCLWSSRLWHLPGTWLLEELAPHRRKYLQYQGALTDGRGWVRRIDHGHALALDWSEQRLLLDVTMQHFTGRVRLERLHGPRWRATVCT